MKMDEIQEFDGINYRKVFDGSNDSVEMCKRYCCFCQMDDAGEPCCANPCTPDFRFDGCAVGHFHWEKIER